MAAKETMNTMYLSVVLFLAQHFLTVLGVNQTLIATPTLQDDLLSPGYLFNLDYGANVTYDYLVYTNYFNHTLTLTVVDCEIESDKNGDCLYDHLYIYDGPDNSSTLIFDFCCASSNPSPTFTTTGNQSYLRFTTDASNNFRGFKLSYVSTGVTTTTSTTTTTVSTSTTTSTTTTTTPTTTTSTTTTSTTSTTATTPTTTTDTPSPSGSEDSGSDTSQVAIIGGAAGGGFLLLLLLIILVVCLLKNKRPVTPADRDTKRVLWSRGSTMVKEFQVAPQHLPPGSVTQTNIFELDLPEPGRNNLLPPLSSKLDLPGPTIEAIPPEKSI